MRCVAILLGFAGLSMSLAAPASQVWFAGVDPVVAADRAGPASHASPTESDFMNLFSPHAPWQKSAAAIQVFKLSTQFLQRADDAQLRTVIQDLHRRHIALAMEAEILVATAKCGNGMPGYTTSAVIQKAARRVSQLGGEIAYVAFDEPMTWGHFAHRACQYPTEAVVRNIAPNIKFLKSVFPAVRFGDIEPVTDQTPGRLTDILDFASIFKAETGESLSFLQADLIWQNNWRPQLIVWKTRLHAAGLAYGVVIDGDPADRTDAAWVDHAVERYRKLAADPAVAPDEYVFQSWQPKPARFLPEDQPGTLANAILRTVAH